MPSFCHATEFYWPLAIAFSLRLSASLIAFRRYHYAATSDWPTPRRALLSSAASSRHFPCRQLLRRRYAAANTPDADSLTRLYADADYAFISNNYETPPHARLPAAAAAFTPRALIFSPQLQFLLRRAFSCASRSQAAPPFFICSAARISDFAYSPAI